MADLMMDFESIGGGCEFGVVQRCCGAEPLGLLRFTGAAIGNLVNLFESGLAGFLTPDDIGIDVQGSEREYMVFSRRYKDFFSHTNAFVDRDDEAVILAREIKKVGYLKRRFELDWQDASRIYVHCGCEDETTILTLHAALRAKSDCVLLWIVKARSPEERGRVEVRAPNLLKGYLAHYGTFDGGPRLDLPGWAKICRSAEAIVHRLPAPSTSPSPINAEFVWARAPCGSLEAGPTSGRCRVLYGTKYNVAVGEVCISAKIPGRSLVVFSVWVRLAASFRGQSMLLTVDDAILINHRRADLSDVTWQQMWVVARVVEPKEALRFSFYVEASRGSAFHFGGWQIEEGGIPDEGLRPIEAVPLVDLCSTQISASRSHRIRSWAAQILAKTAIRVRPVEESVLPSLHGMTSDALLRTADSLLRTKLFDEADGLLCAGKILFPWQAELFTHYALCAQSSGTSPKRSAAGATSWICFRSTPSVTIVSPRTCAYAASTTARLRS